MVNASRKFYCLILLSLKIVVRNRKPIAEIHQVFWDTNSFQ